MTTIKPMKETVEVIRLYEVADAEPIQLRYYRDTRLIPQNVAVTFVDGKWQRTVISGPNAKKDGTPGANRHSEDYWSGSREDMPEWARPLTVFEQSDADMANAARVALEGE